MVRQTTKMQNMPSSEIGAMIRKQREAMKMTVAQLAKLVGVSRNTITNYESDKTEPSASDLVRLSNALGCRVEEFLGVVSPSDPPRFAFRAHVPLRRDPSITVAARKYLTAYQEIEQIMDSRLCGTLRTFACENDGPWDKDEIETIADTLRQKSGLHDAGPENITSVLESIGVRTLFFEHPAKGFDGLSTMQGDTQLVMLRKPTRLAERTIFSAAHELGHLVLHRSLFTSDIAVESDGKRYEDEANRFAGNFLVPRVELMRLWHEERLERLSLFNALLLLKRAFHVSFPCLYYRVTELGLNKKVMDQGYFVNEIKKKLGISGKATMDQLEPEPIKLDSLYLSTRFSRLVRSAFLQELIGVDKVAEMFQVSVERANEITNGWVIPDYELVDECSV